MIKKAKKIVDNSNSLRYNEKHRHENKRKTRVPIAGPIKESRVSNAKMQEWIYYPAKLPETIPNTSAS